VRGGITPTTLATSSAAPPPKPITLSAPCALKAAAPAITCAQVGLPNTPSNTATSSPPRWRSELGQHRQRCQGGQRPVGDDQRALMSALLQQVRCRRRACAGAGAEVDGAWGRRSG
jgi:hypothetical protein